MQFSVVIPLYNKSQYINRALNSVLFQSIQDFEIVVIDDGSVDGGGDLVRKYADQRIRLIRQENQGASAARNNGYRVTRSEFVAFLDADDEWKPGFLEKIKELVEKFPNCGAFGTSFEIIDKNNM